MNKPPQVSKYDNKTTNAALGRNFVAPAAKFYAAFPDGTEFDAEQFEQWQQGNELGEYNPTQLRNGINNAAMRDDSEFRFWIQRIGKQRWKTRSVTYSVIHSELADKIAKVMTDETKDLERRMIQINQEWDAFPVTVQMALVAAYNALTSLKEQTVVSINQVSAAVSTVEWALDSTTTPQLPASGEDN